MMSSRMHSQLESCKTPHGLSDSNVIWLFSCQQSHFWTQAMPASIILHAVSMQCWRARCDCTAHTKSLNSLRRTSCTIKVNSSPEYTPFSSHHSLLISSHDLMMSTTSTAAVFFSSGQKLPPRQTQVPGSCSIGRSSAHDHDRSHMVIRSRRSVGLDSVQDVQIHHTINPWQVGQYLMIGEMCLPGFSVDFRQE